MRAGATWLPGLLLLFSPAPALTQQSAQAPPAAQVTAASAQSPEAIYQSLVALRVDPAQVYTVHDLAIRREGVAFTFSDGKLAFLQPLHGHITGAVFLGRGRIFALPPDAAERASLARYLKVPFLDAEFDHAYFRFDASLAGEIQGQLAEDKVSPQTDAPFAEAWNPTVAQFNLSSSLRALEGQLAVVQRPYLYGALDSPGIGSFDVLLDERRPETVLIGQPRRANQSVYFDIWTSFTAPNAPPVEAEFEPLDYSVDTQIADDLSLTGAATIHFRALTSSRVLELELSRFLHVQSVTDSSGQTYTFFQNQELRRQDIARRGNDLLFIVFPAPTAADQENRLHITYQGTVIEDAGNGVYFVGARGSWYPHLAGSDRFTPFDLTFRWPKSLILVATGEQVSSSEDNSTRSGEWHTSEPIALAGFNLGNYASLTVGEKPVLKLFANQQLEDAILARLESHETNPAAALPSGSGLPHPASSPDNPFPLPLPNPAAYLKGLGGKLLDSVHFYEGLDGPFPFPELDISQIPGNFGQGWPGLLYLSTLVFLPPQTQEQAGVAERAQEQIEQLVPYHEVAHQWWGNVVAPKTYRDVWLEEAMANYLALLYDESRHPARHELQNWLARFRDSLLAKQPDSDEPMDAAGPLDFGYRLESSRTPEAYNIIVYDKGAWVIHMLREMLRNPRAKDPDERFRQLLLNVLSDYRFQSLSNAQFQREVERLMTPAMDLEGAHSMDWFFEQWVRETGIPEYSATFRVRPRGARFEIEGTLAQEDVPDEFTESVPIYGVRLPGKPELLGHVVTLGRETKFHFFARFRPSRLLIDPEHTILCRAK
jgi:hypothetical protein